MARKSARFEPFLSYEHIKIYEIGIMKFWLKSFFAVSKMRADTGEIIMRKLNKLILLFVIIVLVAMAFVACDIFKGSQDGNKDGVTFTITFDTQGGSEVKPLVLKEGETINLPNNPTKDGYIFEGWYLSDEFIEKFNATQTISSDITVYAKWKEDHSGELEFSLNDDGTGYVVVGIGDCTDNNIIIPSKYNSKPVTDIGYRAFFGCTGVTSITISDSVKSIGEGAFENCVLLSSITVSENNAVYSSACGVLYDKNKTQIICVPNFIKGTIIIPEGILSIPSDTFKIRRRLTNVTIPDSVTSIGNHAFDYCTGLTSIVIPDSVTSIGSDAFFGCTGLTSVTIGNGVTSVGAYAFYDCYKLIEVYNKSSLDITAGSFDNGCVARYAKNVYSTDGDSKLSTDDNGYVIYTNGNEKTLVGYIGSEKYLILPSDITKIYNYAFYNQFALNNIFISITIPRSVTEIGDLAFADCVGLIEVYNKSSLNITAGSENHGDVAYYAKNVYTEEGGSKLSTDDNGYVIYTDGIEKILASYIGTETELILPSDITQINNAAFARCDNITSVSITNGLTVIGMYAFICCTQLNSINIPDTVASIGEGAFCYCTKLTSIVIPNSVTSIGDIAFWGCSELKSISYRGTMVQWESITKGSSWKYNVPKSCKIICSDGTIDI